MNLLCPQIYNAFFVNRLISDYGLTFAFFDLAFQKKFVVQYVCVLALCCMHKHVFYHDLLHRVDLHRVDVIADVQNNNN